jgi:hypothetical protein
MKFNDIIKLFDMRDEWNSKVDRRKYEKDIKFNSKVLDIVMNNMTPEQRDKFYDSCSHEELLMYKEIIHRRMIGIKS